VIFCSENDAVIMGARRIIILYTGEASSLTSFHRLFAARGSDGSIVFSIVKNCQHDNSRTAALSLMKFCMSMSLDDLWNPTEHQGRRLKFFGFCAFLACMILLEPGFTKCHSIDGAALLLPAEATAATRVQYLTLFNLFLLLSSHT